MVRLALPLSLIWLYRPGLIVKAPDVSVIALAVPVTLGTGRLASGSVTAWAEPKSGDGLTVEVAALVTVPTTWMALATSCEVPVRVTAGETGELTTIRPGTLMTALAERASLPVGSGAEAVALVT